MPETCFLLYLLLPLSKSKIDAESGAVLSALALYMYYLKCKNLSNNSQNKVIYSQPSL